MQAIPAVGASGSRGVGDPRRGTPQTIAFLETQLAHLRRQARDLIAAATHFQALFDRLVSVTGIATATAIQRMGERLVIPQDRRPSHGWP